MIPNFQEFPKALYASAAGDGYRAAYHHAEELELRAQGLRMLPEWYASAAAGEATAAQIKAQAEIDAQRQADEFAAELVALRSEVASLRAEKAERESAAAKKK